MTGPDDPTYLESVIDELWRRSSERTVAGRRLQQKLTEKLLAAWDAAATFGPPSGWVVFRYPTTIAIFDASAELRLVVATVHRGAAATTDMIIEYRTTERCVALSPHRPATRATRDPANVLLALQFIRDHLDSTLLKPPGLRTQDLARFAAAANIDDDTFRRLASWYPTVARHVEAE